MTRAATGSVRQAQNRTSQVRQASHFVSRQPGGRQNRVNCMGSGSDWWDGAGNCARLMMMGMFDLWKKRMAQLSPDAVREALFDAAMAAKESELRALCRRYHALILEHFPAWQIMPAAERDSPERVQRYAYGLKAVAQVFAETGETTLIERLQEHEEQAPLLRWQYEFGEARELMGDGRLEEALAKLRGVAEDMSRRSGSAVAAYLPMVQGAMGQAYVGLHRFRDAYEVTFTALAGCQASGDVEGIICYCGNLAEICRRMGRLGEWRRWLITTTNLMIQVGRAREAKALRRQHGVVPADARIQLSD